MKLGNFHVKFQHLTAEGITLVKVLDLQGNPVAEAAKVKPKNSSYDRKRGREAVLRKVLDTAVVKQDAEGNDYTTFVIQKADRAAIWNDYNNRHTPTNFVEITIKEGNSVVRMEIDGTRKGGVPVLGISLQDVKDKDKPSLLASVFTRIMAGLGVPEPETEKVAE